MSPREYRSLSTRIDRLIHWHSHYQLQLPVASQTATCFACHPITLTVRQPSPCSPRTLRRARLPFLLVFHLVIKLFVSPIPPFTLLPQRRFLFLPVINQLISPIAFRETPQSLRQGRVCTRPAFPTRHSSRRVQSRA